MRIRCSFTTALLLFTESDPNITCLQCVQSFVVLPVEVSCAVHVEGLISSYFALSSDRCAERQGRCAVGDFWSGIGGY